MENEESSLVNFRHVIPFVSCQNFAVEGKSHLNLTKEPLSAMNICNIFDDIVNTIAGFPIIEEFFQIVSGLRECGQKSY